MKNRIVLLIGYISVLFFCSCSSFKPIPSPMDVLYFTRAITDNDIKYIKEQIKKNKEITNVGGQMNNGGIVYPIHTALYYGSDEVVKLVANKKNSNIILEVADLSPLEIAINNNRSVDVFEHLIRNGADINRVSKIHETNIFHAFALANRNCETWKYLSKYATKELINGFYSSDHITPIVLLIQEQINIDFNNGVENTEILLKEFIESGANPNVLVYLEDLAFQIINVLNEINRYEYKKVLLDGMRNSEPIENSMELLQKLERM